MKIGLYELTVGVVIGIKVCIFIILLIRLISLA